ncbi:MAG: hypothetical protein K9G59_08795 [Caulobacter sp.]|nr:hypothetical protein [Caulobacter sp.]
MIGKLGVERSVLLVVAIACLGVGLVWERLPNPESTTINPQGALLIAVGIQVAVITAILWLGSVNGRGRFGAYSAMLAGFALIFLSRLIPDSGSVSADAAVYLGMIALLLVGVIAINLGQAWNKPDEPTLTNPSGTGISA